MKEGRITRDPCGMAFDASSTLFREFDLPFTNDEQVSKVVRLVISASSSLGMTSTSTA